MKKGRVFRPFFYLLAIVFMPAVGLAGEQTISVKLDLNSYSEASSLQSIAGEWNDRIGKGDEAWLLLRLTLGYQNGNYSLQSIIRDDTFYRFANDTAQFVYLTKNHLALDSDRQFRLLIVPDKSSSRGLRFGFRHQFEDRLTLAAFISLLKPTRLVQGRLEGQAQAIGSNDYDFNFTSDLVYGDDPLFERTTGGLNGLGYSLDLTGAYQLGKHWRIDFQLLDVASDIRLDNVPYTTATATSDIKQFGDDGYLTYDPAISGRDGFKDYRYRFEPQMRFQLRYQLEQDAIVLEHRRVYGFDYQKLIYQQSTGFGELGWRWIPAFKAVGLSWARQHFAIALEADRASLAKMKYISLSGRFFWQW
jgi:hypothetical protein